MCLAVMLATLGVLGAESRVFKEYEVKAAFLFQFALYVEWPASSFSDAQTPITIGLLGKDPFGDFLRKAIEGKTVNQRKLVIKHCANLDEARQCHLLFISSSVQKSLPRILAGLRNERVLTVGDVEDFASQGGIVNLVVLEKTVRFEINPSAVERAGLKISSQVLELARIVRDSPAATSP